MPSSNNQEATRQEEAVLHNAESAFAAIKRKEKEALALATAERLKSKAKKRSGGAVAPLQAYETTKVEHNYDFRAEELAQIMKILRSLNSDLKHRLDKHPDDKETQQKISHLQVLIDLGDMKYFLRFVEKLRSVSKDLEEHRIQFLTSKRHNDGEPGAAAVRKIEGLITQIVKKQSPVESRHIENPPYRTSGYNNNAESTNRASMFSPKGPVSLVNMPVDTRQGNFLADAEKELRVYLTHLKKSKNKAGPQSSGDDLLLQKIEKVELLLQKTARRDYEGFQAEWADASEVIKRHRPKSLAGIKLKFTAVFPFEGKILVNNIEKAHARLDSSKQQKKR